MLKQSAILICVFLMLLSGSLKSQSLVATYTEKRKVEGRMPEESDPKIREMIQNSGIKTKELSISGGTSMYKEKQKVMDESSEHIFIMRVGDDDISSVYKNLLQNQLIKQQEFFGRSFLIRETLKPISWKLATEQKNIGSYTCRKATAVIDTFNVVAWYCADIAVNDGPDVFWGLPGLILEVNVNDGKKTITADAIKITNGALTIEVPQKGKEVTQQEYEKIKKDKMEEMRQANPSGEGNKVHIQISR